MVIWVISPPFFPVSTGNQFLCTYSDHLIHTSMHLHLFRPFDSHKHAFLNIKAHSFMLVLLIHAHARTHFAYTCSYSHSYMNTAYTNPTF